MIFNKWFYENKIFFKRILVENIILNIINPTKDKYVLAKLHEGKYGNHLGTRSLTNRALITNYYWSTLRVDSISYVKRCDKCQNLPKYHTNPLSASFQSLSHGIFMK